MFETEVQDRYLGTHCSGRSTLAGETMNVSNPSVAMNCASTVFEHPKLVQERALDVTTESILRSLDRNDPRRVEYLRSRWQQSQPPFDDAYDELERRECTTESRDLHSSELEECPMKQDSTRQALEMFSSVNNADVPDAVRKMVEESVAKGRQTYEDMSALASKNSDAWREIRHVAEAGAQDIQAKLVDNSARNIEAAFEAANAMARAKTVAELFQLQANFTQQQFALFASQSKELLDLSFNVTKRTADSINEAAASMLDNVKRFE